MIPADQLNLPAATIRLDDNSLLINGNVYRKPAQTKAISGHLDIQIIAPDGRFLAHLTTLITPDPVPTEGRGESGYHIRFGLIPPPGSTLRIEFIPHNAIKTN